MLGIKSSKYRMARQATGVGVVSGKGVCLCRSELVCMYVQVTGSETQEAEW